MSAPESGRLSPPRLRHTPLPGIELSDISAAAAPTTSSLVQVQAAAPPTDVHSPASVASTSVAIAQSAQHAAVAAHSPSPAATPPLASAHPHRWLDNIFHHHEHPEIPAEDADLPEYDAPAVAPLMAAVKGGIKAAAPFAFLNYLLLLTILYGANYRASFNGFNARIMFCDHDGGAESEALFRSFISITNPTPNPGVFATVQKTTCSSVDDLKAQVLAHASNGLGKDIIVGGVLVPAGFTSDVQGFEAGTVPSIRLKLTTVADEGFNPSFMNRAVNPVFTLSIAHYNSLKTQSFFKTTLDAGIAAAAATPPGSPSRQSLVTPAQATAMRLNPASPIGGLASTLGVIFLFVQAQVALMMIHPMLMPLFGKIKFKSYINLRRMMAYGMTTCFAFIAAALTAIFGTFNGYIDGRIWILLFLSCWLVITTFGVTISFCQFMFGPLAPTAIGIFMALNVASAQFDAPWACLPDFFQLGRALAMPNGVELIRCVLFGSCYNVGANVGILIASQLLMMIVLSVLSKSAFSAKMHGEKMQKLGRIVSPSAAPPANQQGAMHAGLGMAITAH